MDIKETRSSTIRMSHNNEFMANFSLYFFFRRIFPSIAVCHTIPPHGIPHVLFPALFVQCLWNFHHWEPWPFSIFIRPLYITKLITSTVRSIILIDDMTCFFLAGGCLFFWGGEHLMHILSVLFCNLFSSQVAVLQVVPFGSMNPWGQRLWAPRSMILQSHSSTQTNGVNFENK